MRPELWLQACGAISSGRLFQNPAPLGHLTLGGYPRVQQTGTFVLQEEGELIRQYGSSANKAPDPRSAPYRRSNHAALPCNTTQERVRICRSVHTSELALPMQLVVVAQADVGLHVLHR